MAKASAQYYVDFSWYLWLKNPPRLTTPQKFWGFLFGKIENAVLYIVKGKVQQKPPFKRDIEWGNVKGFGTIPTRENPRPAHSVKTGIFTERVPLSYACCGSSKRQMGTHWKAIPIPTFTPRVSGLLPAAPPKDANEKTRNKNAKKIRNFTSSLPQFCALHGIYLFERLRNSLLKQSFLSNSIFPFFSFYLCSFYTKRRAHFNTI